MNSRNWLKPCGLAVAVFALGVAPALAAEGPPPGADSAPAGAPDFELPAVQIRIATDRALAEHAFLVIEAMRTSAEGAGAEFEAAADALEQNTVAIEGLIADVATPAEAEAFGEQWRNHIAYLVDYARAVADGDTDAQTLAEHQLHTYSTDFSALLVDAFPSLPDDVVEELVAEHVAQLEQVTRLAEGDYDEAFPGIRETYAHMFAIGDGLTTGFLSRLGPGVAGRDTAFSPALDMRLALDRLLGEHTYLAATVMRASVDGGPHLDAAVEAVDANSSDLAEQIAAIYGADAGAAFRTLWDRHIANYVDYVAATTDADEDAQQAALDALATYRSDFSAFLADANPHLDADALESLLEVHTDHLVDQVAAYAEGDYAVAFQMLRHGYAQTEELAAGLAGAIADQFPQLFPDTAATRAPAGLPRFVPVGLAAVLLATLVALRTRRRAML